MVPNSQRTVVNLRSTAIGALAVSASVLVGCWRTSQPALEIASQVQPSCQLGGNGDPYFGGTFPRNPDNAALHFGMLLFAMREPSLACGSGPEEGYRVLHYPVFAPEVQTIRIAHDGARAIIASLTITRRTDGTWPITSRMEKELSLKDWDQFSKLVHQTSMWSALPELPRRPASTGGVRLDGSTWIVEARAAGKHWVIVRGELEREFADVVRLLFEFAGRQPPDDLGPDR